MIPSGKKTGRSDLSDAINTEFGVEAPANLNQSLTLTPSQAIFIHKQRKVSTLFEDARKTNRVHYITVLISRAMMAFSLLSMTLSLVAKEQEINLLVSKFSNNEQSNVAFYCSICGIIVSVLMVIMNIFRKMLTFKLSKLHLERKEDEPFWTATSFRALVIQSIVLGVCPVPFFVNSNYNFCTTPPMVGKQICYKYNDFLHIFQFCKLYFIIKWYIAEQNSSSCSSYRICSIFGVKNTNTFVIKCTMKEIPLKFIMSMFIFGILVFGYALRIAETPVWLVDQTLNLTEYFTCCWTAMLTMTTVGYGDFYPKTTLGRFIMFGCCLYGMVVVSLMVNFVSQELQLSNAELKAYTVINRLEIKRDLKAKATEIVGMLGKYISLKARDDTKTVPQRNQILATIIQKNKDIKNLNNVYKATHDSNNDEDTERNFAVITNEMKEIKQMMKMLQEGVDRYNKKFEVAK